MQSTDRKIKSRNQVSKITIISNISALNDYNSIAFISSHSKVKQKKKCALKVVFDVNRKIWF